MRPGVEVEVREKQPFDGPLVVSVDGQDRTLGEKVARQILVRSTDLRARRQRPPPIDRAADDRVTGTIRNVDRADKERKETV